ncbi:uncharacterized protein LOC114873850 [Osmia bicornis bicornis]|uniref:uncharacterized protein LOC114873850 n=1 Tax=Osmia bicornis bicornis TaxID=1437191 RepID=UPI0010F4D36C|nr:uncharacterized protein LOC114873850 [Osmia bicornis bicornis]XP_029038419.1 uncharacterized protein LOC114873850 [Osmia bicornis bicornis]
MAGNSSEDPQTSKNCKDESDINWNSMLQYAELQQQEYYELLAEWTKYSKHEYKYLKQNIGFALFGPPSDAKEANTKLNEVCKTDDIVDLFHYRPRAQEIIGKIYKKVCEYGEGQVEKECIHFGIIFNITFRTKRNSTKASKSDKTKEKNTKTVSKTNSKEEKKENSKKEKEQDSSNESEMNLQATPIFKIKRLISGKDERLLHSEWYIDAWGRVYQNWTAYKNNNTLPPCTMVIPMHGYYQPDPSYEITEEYSTVWLEVLESPECSTTSSILNAIDTTSNVVGVVSLGLGIASMFTPLAPVTLGAVVTAGVTGAWTAGRSVHNLVDRSNHMESISVTDRDALCSWLAISGSVVGLAASTGTILLTKAAQNGSNISNIVKLAYNTVVLSNLGINGCGVAFRAYSMYMKYQEEQTIRVIDVLSVGTHILFFGNAALNFKFAGELIETTQGKILDDYRSTLRSKRLRKAFNRTKRAAAANNQDKISENAEVIRYINKKMDLQLNPNAQSNFTSSYNTVSFEGGKITINGITLLDPMKFVMILNALDKNPTVRRASSMPEDRDAEDTLTRLRNLLIRLLTDAFTKNDSKDVTVPNVEEFDEICQDMKYMKDATSLFPLIFQIAIRLLERVYGVNFIDKAVHFIWCYVRESLKQVCFSISSFINDAKIQKKVSKIIIALFEHMDEVVDGLLPAFTKYMRTNLEETFNYY